MTTVKILDMSAFWIVERCVGMYMCAVTAELLLSERTVAVFSSVMLIGVVYVTSW
jgi:hypothetical protein